MEKWSFNMPLFSRLSEVLDITGTEIARRCGMRQQVLSRYTTNESVVNIKTLMQICNAIRMPIYFFVAEDHNYIIPNRESATIPRNEWQPVSWNYDNVNRIFGDGDGKINWKDVAVAMGSSSQKPHQRFDLRRRFKVTDFFVACNAFNLSPFLFLNDPNRPGKKKDKGKNVEKRPAFPTLSDLSAQMGKLTETVNDLQQKYNELQQNYADLQQKYASLLEFINLNNVGGISTGVDMAAENGPKK